MSKGSVLHLSSGCSVLNVEGFMDYKALDVVGEFLMHPPKSRDCISGLGFLFTADSS